MEIIKQRNRFFKISLLAIIILMLFGCTNQGFEGKDNLNKQQSENDEKYNELYSSYSNKVLEIIELEYKIEDLNDEVLGLEGNIIGIYNEMDRRIEGLLEYKRILENNKDILLGKIKPDYIFNIFDPLYIEEGEKIAGLIVAEKDIDYEVKFNRPIYEDVKFSGEFKVKCNVIRQESELVTIRIKQPELINIPIPFNDLHIEYIELTVLNGDELINAIGNDYSEETEIIGVFSGFRYYGKIEAGKMMDTEFLKLQ